MKDDEITNLLGLGNQTLQMYGSFERFSLNSALFGLVMLTS